MQLFNSKQKITHAEAAQKRKARIMALGGVGSDQHEAAARGVERFAARFTAAGDPATGAELKALADKAGRLLADRDEARAAFAALNVNHVGEAVQAAASELVKKMPGCFPCMADAVQYAERLPLSQARAQATAQASAKNALTNKATDAHRALVAVLDEAGRVALSEQDGVRSLRELALTGEK